MKYINGLTQEELSQLISQEGLPAFRAKQIFQWVHKKMVGDFAGMTNISKPDQDKLSKLLKFYPIKIKKTKHGPDGTKKYLLELEDDNCIESVLLQDRTKRKTICASTQVGCALGCAICATAKLGFIRDLTCAEIVGQIELFHDIDNIVFMGMGEPLLNYDNVIKSIIILNHPNGLNIGARKITISTAGIPDKIMALADFPLQVRLAVSVNSADHDKRSAIMPINKTCPIQDVIQAVAYYIKRTGRRVTFEYVLLNGFNDLEEDAYALLDLCEGLKVNINLIPANSPPPPYAPSNKKNQEKFLKLLLSNGLNAVLRTSKGEQIKAGCGQLSQVKP